VGQSERCRVVGVGGAESPLMSGCRLLGVGGTLTGGASEQGESMAMGVSDELAGCRK